MKRWLLLVFLCGMVSLDAMELAKKAGQTVVGVASGVASVLGGVAQPVVNGIKHGKDAAIHGTQTVGGFVAWAVGCGPRKKFCKKKDE